MAEFSNLQPDSVISGSELVAVLDGSNGKKASIESIKDYIQRQLETQVNVSNVAASFSRQYPVVGSIKKGQACGIFRDSDNTLKMKASDNTNSLIASMSDTESFDTNIDGFELDRALSSGDLTVKPKDQDYITSSANAYVQGSGIEFTLTQNSSNSDLWEWNGRLWLSESTSSRRRWVSVYSITYNVATNSGRICLTGHISSTSNRYMTVSAISGSYYTLFNSSSYSGFNNRCFGFSLNSAHLTSFNTNRKLYFGISWTSSYPNSNQYQVAEVEGDASQDYNLDSDLIDDNFIKLPFTQRGSSDVYDFTPANPVYLQKLFTRFIPQYSFSGMSLNTSTGVLTITSTTSNKFFSIWIKADDTDIIKDLPTSTSARNLSTFTVTLNPGQISAFTSNNNSLEIRLTDNLNITNKFENISNFYFPFEQSSDDVTLSDFEDLSSLLVQNIFKISSTKAIIEVSGVYNSYDSPDFDSSGNYNGNSKKLANSQSSSRFFVLVEYANDTWSITKVFNPVMLNRNKTTGLEEVSNISTIYKAYEDEDEIHFACLNSVGFLCLVKYTKADNSFEYFVNETDDLSGNRFSLQDVGEFGSGNWFQLQFRQVSAQGQAHNYFYAREGGRQSSSSTSGHDHYLTIALLQGTISDAENSSYQKMVFSQLEVDDIGKNIPYDANTGVISELVTSEKRLTMCWIGSALTSSNPRIVYWTVRFNSDFSAFQKTYNSATKNYDGTNVFYESEYYIFYNNWLNPRTNNFESIGAPAPLFNVLSLRLELGVNIDSKFLLNNPVYDSSTGTLTAGKDYSFGFAGYSANSGVAFSERRASRASIITFSDADNRPTNLNRKYGFVNEPQLLFFYNNDKNFIKIADPVSVGLAVEFDTRVATAIGLAQDNYSEGDTGTLSYLKGSSVITLSGLSLVVGADYYFNNVTGELNSSGGRRVGRAISETELLVA